MILQGVENLTQMTDLNSILGQGFIRIVICFTLSPSKL